MYGLTQKGDDLAAFVRDVNADAAKAADMAARRLAARTAGALRRIIRTNFGTEWRVWDAKGLGKTIRYKKIDHGYYRVYSKATYLKGRSTKVDLLWVFDTAPVVRGLQRQGVAIPVKNAAPIHSNGRRYFWPSEAAAAGWQLQTVPVLGKKIWVIWGRRNAYEDYRALWIWKPSVKMPKRLDLDGLHRRQSQTFDDVWGEILDELTTKRSRARHAA